MAERNLSGVEDALEGLIGSSDQTPARPENGPKRARRSNERKSGADKPFAGGKGPTAGGQSTEPEPESKESDQEQDTTQRIPQRTPTGRPPGRKNGEGELKARATVWVSAELIEEYRQRVWDERCHLGELIERALREYKERHW